jgi:hypothetical protein
VVPLKPGNKQTRLQEFVHQQTVNDRRSDGQSSIGPADDESHPAPIQPGAHRVPRGQGRRVKQGTVLAAEMTRRNIRKTRLTAVMHCSDRQLYNYMARQIPIPAMQLSALCDEMDMYPEDLVNDRYVLLETEPSATRAVAPDEVDDG